MAENIKLFGVYSDIVTEILQPKFRKDKIELINRLKELNLYVTISDIHKIDDTSKKGFKFDIGKACRAGGSVENGRKYSEKYFVFKADKKNWNRHYSNTIHAIKILMCLKSIDDIPIDHPVKQPNEIIIWSNLTLYPIKDFELSEYYITKCGRVFSTQS
jgi:hypothetical protein